MWPSAIMNFHFTYAGFVGTEFPGHQDVFAPRLGKNQALWSWNGNDEVSCVEYCPHWGWNPKHHITWNTFKKNMTTCADSMKMQHVSSTVSWNIHVVPWHAHVCRFKRKSSLSTYKSGAMALNEPLQHHSGSLCQQGISGVSWQIVLIKAQNKIKQVYKTLLQYCSLYSTRWYKLQVHQRATNTLYIWL